jgi:NAD(P)-dependent dehydrogenase (short-subunit alcohol dehydrogenase family)
VKDPREIAWITGGASGIGLACAIELAKSGRRVAITGRDAAKLEKALSLVEEYDPDAIAMRCDVTKEDDVTSTVKEIENIFGAAPDILINNAGISPYQDIEEMSIETFDAVIDTNLIGNFLCAKAVIPAMITKGKGTIVQMLSIASKKAFAGGTAYGASKFAALGMTNALREDVRDKGIKVIAVMPGATETPTWDDDELGEFRHKMMQPEDIAKVIIDAISHHERALVEELIIRPIGGDL